MKRKTLAIATMATLGLGVLGAWLIGPGTQPEAEAADHNDPPGRVMGASGDRAADIGDLYVFTRDENTVFVLTLAGPAMPDADQAGVYDPDVLYQIHVDTNGLTVAGGEINMNIRFAENASGHWGMEIENFPGASGMVVGAVEAPIAVASGGQAWAGLRDDPFFFDSTGFGMTGATGELSFDNARDGFAGQNITAIVIEVPNAAIAGQFDAWASTSRITSGG